MKTNVIKTLPYTALRTLEAVVRLNGFGRAAEELNVTQSAVSQHVKSLEVWIGQALLVRGARKTVPTAEGLRLAAAVSDGFTTIQTVCDDLRNNGRVSKQGVLVASPPGFAFVWLLPRLIRFDELFPDIPVSLNTDIYSPEFDAAQADILIRYGVGGFPGLHSEQLLAETITPVCSPALAKSLNAIEDLAQHTILRDDVQRVGTPPTWEYWADETGVKLPNLRHNRKFGQANMVVQAAIEGLGVAMGRSPLVSDHVSKGALVCPFDEFALSKYSYWLVCEQNALQKKSVKAFRKWLFAEAKALPSMMK